jgi:hypothetical protein
MMLQNAGTFTVLSRSEAAESGLSRFYTATPCRAGHQSERYVSNRQCVACNAAKARHREQLRGVRDPSLGCTAMYSAALAWPSGAALVQLTRLAANMPNCVTI